MKMAKPTFKEVAELTRQLSARDRARLRRMLDEEWQKDFDAALESVRAKAAKFGEQEIDDDVAEALTEVRSTRRAQSGR